MAARRETIQKRDQERCLGLWRNRTLVWSGYDVGEPALPDDLATSYPTYSGVVEKAMAKEPDERYLSAGDFARDASAALSGMRYSGPPTSVATVGITSIGSSISARRTKIAPPV